MDEATKQEGRRLVAACDIDALMPWVRKHAPVGLSHDIYERSMRMCFAARDTLKALKMHNAVFDTYDVNAERAGLLLRRALGCGALLGLLGGIAVLVLGVIVLFRMVTQ